jgi:hypothetical protein
VLASCGQLAVYNRPYLRRRHCARSSLRADSYVRAPAHPPQAFGPLPTLPRTSVATSASLRRSRTAYFSLVAGNDKGQRQKGASGGPASPGTEGDQEPAGAANSDGSRWCKYLLRRLRPRQNPGYRATPARRGEHPNLGGFSVVVLGPGSCRRGGRCEITHHHPRWPDPRFSYPINGSPACEVPGECPQWCVTSQRIDVVFPIEPPCPKAQAERSDRAPRPGSTPDNGPTVG